MTTEKHNGHTIQVWDSIESLPIDRFQAFQLYLSLDAGIGGNMENVGTHISMLHKFIEADKKAEALQQLANYQQSLFFIISNLNPTHNAFACLIFSIDGELRNDFSESGIKATLEVLAKKKFTAGRLGELLDTLKKKLSLELSTCFPSSNVGKERDYFTQIKNRTIFALRRIRGIEVDKKIRSIDDYLLRLMKPQNFAGLQGLEVKAKKDFQNACGLISQHLNITEPEKLTVFGFYSRLEILKKQLKPKK